MHIRITTDPMTFNEVTNPDSHPCIYEGDGMNGLEIYFETEESRDQFLAWKHDQDSNDLITLTGNDSDDYIAEG
ncbi:MAG: hypothetical protein OEZ38_03345 [Gammaproteobacteria bacterium]|nr:hypothetical protein [Gammaproteobacteria bacterium]